MTEGLGVLTISMLGSNLATRVLEDQQWRGRSSNARRFATSPDGGWGAASKCALFGTMISLCSHRLLQVSLRLHHLDCYVGPKVSCRPWH